MKAWKQAGQNWPPALGDKVRLFTPKDLRGRVAKVIAIGPDKAKNSTRVAPKGKARILVKDATKVPHKFAVAQSDVFPSTVSLKELQAL